MAGVVEAVLRSPDLLPHLPDDDAKRALARDLLAKVAQPGTDGEYREKALRGLLPVLRRGLVDPSFVRTGPEVEKCARLVNLPAIYPFFAYAARHGSCPHAFDGLRW